MKSRCDSHNYSIFSETNIFLFQKLPPNMSRPGLNMILKFVSICRMYIAFCGTKWHES